MSQSSRAIAPRVIATIIAVAVAMQSLAQWRDPAGTTSAVWSVVPVPLAIAALVLLWLPRPSPLPAVVLLFGAVLIQGSTLFADLEIPHVALGAVAIVLAVVIGWLCLVLPVLVWRRGRWPVEPVGFGPLTAGAQWPEPVQQRAAALAKLGFAPRLVHARAEADGTATIVALAHCERDALATVTHLTLNGITFTGLRITPMPAGTGPRVVLIDMLAPAPFPPPPTQRVLLFPGADAATLFARFLRLHDHDAQIRSDEELIAALEEGAQRYDRWLVDAGYLTGRVDSSGRRYTLKGSFSAVLRTLRPWHAIEGARLARAGRAALREVSGARA